MQREFDVVGLGVSPVDLVTKVVALEEGEAECPSDKRHLETK